MCHTRLFHFTVVFEKLYIILLIPCNKNLMKTVSTQISDKEVMNNHILAKSALTHTCGYLRYYKHNFLNS